MAKRSRQNRKSIPGYVDHPTRNDRQKQHRQVRHAAHQLLATVEDVDAMSLPEIRRNRLHEFPEASSEIEPRRFRVWKTKFWKRRDGYRQLRERMDARWPEITAEPEEVW